MKEVSSIYTNDMAKLPIIPVFGEDNMASPLRKSCLFENPDRCGQFKVDAAGNRNGIYFAVNYQAPSGEIYQVREEQGGRASLYGPEGVPLCELPQFWDIRDQEVVNTILEYCKVKVEDFVALTIYRHFTYPDSEVPGVGFVVEEMSDIIKMNTIRKLREELYKYGLVEGTNCQATAITAHTELTHLPAYDVLNLKDGCATIIPKKNLPWEIEAQLNAMAEGKGENSFQILFSGASSTAELYEKGKDLTYVRYTKGEQITLANFFQQQEKPQNSHPPAP